MQGERQVGEPVEAAANEFAPNVIPGAGLVDPAPMPEPGELAQKGEAVAVDKPADEIDEEQAQAVVADREFVDYVNTELADIAKSLGYEIILKKIADPNAELSGPTAFYDRDSGEQRIFTRRADVPVGFVSGDELRALREAQAE